MSGQNFMQDSMQVSPQIDIAMPVVNRHFVHGREIAGDFAGKQKIYFGLGCFWGAERKFWSLPGVYTTAVGYGGGNVPNASYKAVCSGQTGHAELVLIVFEPAQISLESLLKIFWECHDPTQGMRQGNDIGSQYRSAIYCDTEAHLQLAQNTRDQFQIALNAAGKGKITTEIRKSPVFYYAEDYHQQYLAKNPGGYCGLRGTGVVCAIDV